MAVEDRPKTAFTINGMGHFEFNLMPFRLQNAPATFQRLMSQMLGNVPGCLTYLDDIIVFGRTREEHDRHLSQVNRILQNNGLRLNHKKCKYNQEEVTFLGHVVSASGIRPDSEKVKAILQIPEPKTPAVIRSFIGLAGYYRKFIPGFSTISEPLRKLTQKGMQFRWTDEQK